MRYRELVWPPSCTHTSSTLTHTSTPIIFTCHTFVTSASPLHSAFSSLQDPSNFLSHLFRDSIQFDCDARILDLPCCIARQGICRSNIALQLLQRKLPILRPYQLHLACPDDFLLRPSASHQVAEPTSLTGQSNTPTRDKLQELLRGTAKVLRSTQH